MKSRIEITMMLEPGAGIDAFQGPQLQCAVERFREGLRNLGIRIDELDLKVHSVPDSPPAAVHAPGCSGAWCDGLDPDPSRTKGNEELGPFVAVTFDLKPSLE